MLKMIIADDEQIILDGITESIDWKSFGIKVVGAAHNGIEALEMARNLNPDIIITDIKMPGLNGLELVRELRKVLPGIKILLISAYEQFDYAQEAISLGVLSYITKPLKKQRIIEEVQKARDIILKEIFLRENQDRLEELYQSSLPTIQEYYHNKLIMGKTKISGDYSKQFDTYGIDIDEHDIGVMVFTLDNLEETSEEFFEKSVQIILLRISEMIKELLPEQFKRTVFQSYNNEVVAIYNTGADHEETIRMAAKTAEKIKNSLHRAIDISISAGLGRIYPSVRDVAASYQEAVKALNYRLVYGNNTVLYIDHVELKDDMLTLPVNDLNELLRRIQDTLWTGKSQEVMLLIRKKIDELVSVRSIPYYYIQQVFCQLLSALLRTLYEMNITPEEIYGKPVHLYGEIFKKHTLDEIASWYENLVERTCKVINEKKALRVGSVINSAVEYIKKNSNKDLSLSEVAEHVNLNPSYLSRLFKEETGIPFVEYVRNIKVDLAKELLRFSSKKIYEICESLGYQNVQYFSTVFKNVTGITPIEYKKQGR